MLYFLLINDANTAYNAWLGSYFNSYIKTETTTEVGKLHFYIIVATTFTKFGGRSCSTKKKTTAFRKANTFYIALISELK